MVRRVPGWLLEAILGTEGRVKMKKDGTPSKAKPKQFQSMVKEGRKDPGMKNPRGGNYMSQDVEQQLRGPVGSHPQESPRSVEEKAIIEQMMRSEKTRKFNRDSVMKKIEDEKKQKAEYKAKKAKKALPGEAKKKMGGVDLDDEIEE
jgi:hypothetical protein